MKPREVLEANFSLVAEILDDLGIEWWLLSSEWDRRSTVGTWLNDRETIFRVLVETGTPANLHVRIPNQAGDFPISELHDSPELRSAEALVLFVPRAVPDSNLVYLGEGSCEIEFWRRSDGVVEAPRENRAARLLSESNFSLIHGTFFGRHVQRPSVLSETMLDDIGFPIDVVYTWVDGDDPAWKEKRERALAAEEQRAFHPEAVTANRFMSRDELKYSLRSLEAYAPWVRKVFLVTDAQVPSWLNRDHPKLEVVDHTELFESDESLPTFNSNAIISRLHHIPGLSEHYLYVNDDVFFGRSVSPEKFFTPRGSVKVSPSNNRRPFLDATVGLEPHYNLTLNMRRLIQEAFGLTISRAVKHTPHPQLKSLHFQMEEMFAPEYANTLGHRFRHHTDIVSDQLHHYVSQALGKGVVAPLRYEYINLGDESYAEKLLQLGERRDRDVFCLNDAPLAGVQPIPDEVIDSFLERYFPFVSSFESSSMNG